MTFGQCGNGGCLIELAQQLAVIMIGRKYRYHVSVSLFEMRKHII